MKINHIRRRVRAIERRISPTGPCPTCNGHGHLVVRIADDLPRAGGHPPHLGGDTITPRLEQDGRAHAARADNSSHARRGCPACGKALILTITGDDHTNPTPTAASAA